MTLYLSPDLTPDMVREAKRVGIVGQPMHFSYLIITSISTSGVKSYPRGVTTNSDSGIESYEGYYPVFQAMEEVGMILNLHGEVPSNVKTVRRIL